MSQLSRINKVRISANTLMELHETILALPEDDGVTIADRLLAALRFFAASGVTDQDTVLSASGLASPTSVAGSYRWI